MRKFLLAQLFALAVLVAGGVAFAGDQTIWYPQQDFPRAMNAGRARAFGSSSARVRGSQRGHGTRLRFGVLRPSFFGDPFRDRIPTFAKHF